MEDIKEKYKETKCLECANKKSKIEEDKCDIRTYQYNDYQYCKCCNMTNDKKEIKQKII